MGIPQPHPTPTPKIAGGSDKGEECLGLLPPPDLYPDKQSKTGTCRDSWPRLILSWSPDNIHNHRFIKGKPENRRRGVAPFLATKAAQWSVYSLPKVRGERVGTWQEDHRPVKSNKPSYLESRNTLNHNLFVTHHFSILDNKQLNGLTVCNLYSSLHTTLTECNQLEGLHGRLHWSPMVISLEVTVVVVKNPLGNPSWHLSFHWHPLGPLVSWADTLSLPFGIARQREMAPLHSLHPESQGLPYITDIHIPITSYLELNVF